MPEEIHLRVKYTEAEYAAAMRAYIDRTFRLRTALAFSGFWTITVLVLWGLGYFPLWPIIITLALLLIVIVIYVRVPSLYFNRQAQLQSELTFRFSDHGVEIKGEGVNVTRPWSFYKRILENKQFYLLIYEGLFTAIPRRTFRDEAEMTAFLRLTQKHIPH